MRGEGLEHEAGADLGGSFGAFQVGEDGKAELYGPAGAASGDESAAGNG